MSVNGPLPTTGIWSLAKFATSAIFDHTCSGTIGASMASIVACGVLVRITNVASSGAVTVSKFFTKLPLAVLAAGSVIIRLNV